MVFDRASLESRGLEGKEIDRSLLLYTLARRLTNKDLVLKGGASLVFGYGLNRWSKDLDFDSSKNKNYRNEIIEALKEQNLRYSNIIEKNAGSRIKTKVLYDKDKSIRASI